MKADLAKLRALHEAAFQWPPKNLDAFAEAMHEALPELLAIAEAVERAPFEYEFEVWQDDAMQAGGTTTTLESAIDEAAHYRMMYGQDGPVEVKVYERRAIPDAAIDRLLAIGEDG